MVLFLLAWVISACPVTARGFDPPFPGAWKTCQQPHGRTADPKQHGTNEPRFVEWINESAPRTEANPTESDQKVTHQWWGLSTDDWLVIFTGALVFVGFIQFLVFRNQAYWLRRTVESTENSMMILEGAYVFADIEGSRIINNPTTQIGLSVRAINHGETVGLISWIGWEVRPFGSSDPTTLPVTLESYRNQSFVGWVLGKSEQRRAEVTVIPSPTAPMLFHGVVIYEDIFGEPHYCGFAWRINSDNSWQPVSGVDAYVRYDKRRRRSDHSGGHRRWMGLWGQREPKRGA